MRDELSKYMTGESVCLVAEIIKHCKPQFDGAKSESVLDPQTGLKSPILFFDPSYPPKADFNAEYVTLIRPISINGKSLNIDHMWVSRNIPQDDGNFVEIRGNIKSYRRSNGLWDYCICPYNIVLIHDLSNVTGSNQVALTFSLPKNT